MFCSMYYIIIEVFPDFPGMWNVIQSCWNSTPLIF
uniref:Uncharacterized protein n=1 Tax=Arundo donax TaxID=35708 RepID=A0A0A9EWV6_ARUDO